MIVASSSITDAMNSFALSDCKPGAPDPARRYTFSKIVFATPIASFVGSAVKLTSLDPTSTITSKYLLPLVDSGSGPKKSKIIFSPGRTIFID